MTSSNPFDLRGDAPAQLGRASGAPRAVVVALWACGGLFPDPGTSSEAVLGHAALDPSLAIGTEAGTSRSEHATLSNSFAATAGTRAAIHELRLLSGLTWDQLAQLFQVTRRSVHFWANGKALTVENETRLMLALDVVRFIDRGFARENRAALLELHDGVSALDLLVQQRFAEARELLGQGPGRKRIAWIPLSPEAQAERRPPRPWELLDQLPDVPVHRDMGISRPAYTLRTKRREQP